MKIRDLRDSASQSWLEKFWAHAQKSMRLEWWNEFIVFPTTDRSSLQVQGTRQGRLRSITLDCIFESNAWISFVRNERFLCHIRMLDASNVFCQHI